MARPLVSIIIPAYNAEEYVGEAVRSALAQTYAPIEVVVVNDGSTDGTEKALAPFRGDKRFVYISQVNKGLAAARNTGIKNSHGGYIAFLDADDIFLPEKLSEQVKALEAMPDFGACYSDLLHFTDAEPPARRASQDDAGRRKFYHHRFYYPSGNILESLLHRQFVNPLAVVARREIFGKYGYFDENLRRSEDWDLWLRWAHAGVKFYYLDKVLAHYRMRSIGNLSSLESEPRMKEKTLELFTRFEKTLSDAERQKYRYAEILKNLRFKAAFAHLLVGDKKTALERLSGSSLFWRLVVAALPASAWHALLAFLRRIKHRLLLKKL